MSLLLSFFVVVNIEISNMYAEIGPLANTR